MFHPGIGVCLNREFPFHSRFIPRNLVLSDLSSGLYTGNAGSQGSVISGFCWLVQCPHIHWLVPVSGSRRKGYIITRDTRTPVIDTYSRMIFLPFVVLICITVPVLAASNTILQGNTVFIGEQGLDISAALDGATQLAWFRPGSNPAVDVPSFIINVENPAGFYISPSDFASRTGNWFQWNGKAPAGPVAFIVEEPAIRLRVFDDTRDYEVRPGVTWVPTGDAVSFTLETNLYQMVQRPGVAGAIISIHVDGPGGLSFTKLTGPDGTENPLRTVVPSSPYNTGPIWDTGRSEYPSGTYELSADCNTNKMNDNYWAGSDTVTMLLQNYNPLLKTTTTTQETQYSPVTTPVTTVVTSAPITPVPATSNAPATPVVTRSPSTTTPMVPSTPGISPTPVPGFAVITALIGLSITALLIRRR